MEKVIVAFENPSVRESVCEMLESGGVARSVPCQSASEVRRLVNMQGIHVVVCGFKFPDAPGETLFYDLPETCAMVMLARKNRLELCETEEIFQLPFPANRGDLLATVEDPQRYNDEVIFPDKVRINLDYYYHHTFIGDIKLIFQTIFKA